MKKDETVGTESKAPRLKVINRRQLIMRTMDIEGLVAEDHPVRAIWEFVGRLDLRGYYEGIEAVEGGAGRSAMDPRMMISLWVYAYSDGVSSAREVSRLCEYHPAYQWLTAMAPINYHTLSDFRVQHKEALQELLTQVLAVLSSEDLITLQRVMHDGTKIKACASADTFRREGRIKAHLKLAEEQVRLLEEAQDEEVSPRVAKARQRAAREKQQRLEVALEELEKIRAGKSGKEEKEKSRVSLTDPEARIMKQSDGGFAPSYNVQISTDAAAKMIVGVRVSQSGSDYGELKEAVEEVEENFGKVPEQVVVDGGFTSRENILAMNDKGVDLIGRLGDGTSQSAAQMDRRGVDPAFHPNAFIYDEATDAYTCPAGKTLRYESKEERIGRIDYKYRARAADCQACLLKQQCCPQTATKGRSIVRGIDAPEVAAFNAKMETEEAKATYKQRGAVAEFPNAWVKDKIGLRQFRLRGLFKVEIEAFLACLTYNIQQWIRLSWRLRLAI